ncbi:hypothetical protein GQ55_3G409400 [Panicum hallii var. hallii]|uniref:Uncharacterized protein n=1 Tax=Panicum hallii var. hallii TaxID=1504633 RepID=A0A2T7EH39_9POAL|nr:hypothetical protein GQ55_3G409400 [Panicum hallii var. hallii]
MALDEIYCDLSFCSGRTSNGSLIWPLRFSSCHFQIPDNTAHRTSSTSEHQLDVEPFRRPSGTYLNPTNV